MTKLLAPVIVIAVMLAGTAASAAAGRNLNNLRITVDNMDRFFKLDARYYDGTTVHLAQSSDADFVKKRIGMIQRDLKYALGLRNALTTEERADPEARRLFERVDWWAGYEQRLVAAFNAAASAKSDGDAVCRAFSKEVMLPERTPSIASLMGTGTNDGRSAGTLVEIKDRAKAVTAACARPEYQNVGLTGCAWMKTIPYQDPRRWCEVAPRWQEILTARVDAEVAATIASFEHRPLVQGQLKGDQSLTFFARAVPNVEGWRDVKTLAEISFPAEWRAQYLERISGMYAAIEVSKKIDGSMLAPIEAAFAQLRADAERAAPSYALPRKDGSDYSVALARKQVAKVVPRASVKQAFLGRSSWRIEKNGLGVPLRRTKPGYVLYKPAGQSWCHLMSYTLTEEYQGGGKYQKARGVSFGYTRVQACK